jgi:formylglycine-generating enzyme required for sulfatase activity
MKRILAVLLTSFLTHQMIAQSTNTLGMKMVEIPAGRFYMGSEGEGETADENPVHRTTISKAFRIGATEVTNAQYEAFDPAHKKFRGKDGFSKEDDEAVIYVDYINAVAFCDWLSKKEGKNYRLPTEAEWEYVCRAGTVTDFSTGRYFPKTNFKSQKTDREPVVVSLKVAQFPANNFGVFDMHGNVEEWCSDWYGAYGKGEQTDPVGVSGGLYKVTRGGSHGTPPIYLRSSNRMAMIPADKHFQLGFRVVEGVLPETKPLVADSPTAVFQKVSQKNFAWKKVLDTKPLFLEPIRYVHKPECPDQVPFFHHNHCPAITWCANGDLLAAWFSTNQESGREMTILASRLRAGQDRWDNPSEFFNVPDRNMTGTSLFDDGNGNLYHMNGVEADGDWKNLAMVLRKSKDNGATWTAPQMADPEHQIRNQVIAGMIKTKEGWLIQAGDADPSSSGGTAIHISKDEGKTWENPYSGSETPEFKSGKTGGLIAGIHAGLVQLKDGSLMALGRNNNIEGADGKMHMPISISKDMGKSWTYSPSQFPPVGGGQRLIFYRTNEGPLLLISFTHHPEETKPEDAGMNFKDSEGKTFKGYGMFAAISYDEGKTWPVKKLLTDGKERYLNGGAWTGAFEMDDTHAEPRGYLALTQSPDNLIHLISSSIHYRFNLKWLTTD